MFHIKRRKKYDFIILDFIILGCWILRFLYLFIGNIYIYEILYLLPDYNNLYNLMLTNDKANGAIQINVQDIVHAF